MSAELKATPPDLTVLAKKNNGVFPIGPVYETIEMGENQSAPTALAKCRFGAFATFRQCRSGLLNQAEI